MVGTIADRAQFGVIIPSTNTAVEQEFNSMLVPGVSWHTGCIFMANPDMSTNEAMEAFLKDLRKEITKAVESVCHAKVDYLVMGMSAETFWGGREGAAEFIKFMGEISSGLKVTTGADSCAKVLEAYGARKIAIVTPYQPVGDEQVVNFFTQMGCEVKAIHGFRCASATSIGDVTPDEIKAAFREVDSPDVELLIQAGTNLYAAKAAAELEEELGKPVIAINTATAWHAYRTNGIMDQFKGWGSLFEKY